jgi:uncharacterized protein (DUF1015 family)
MTKIIPFKAIRPTRDKVHLVASRSYVTYSAKELQAKLNENPYSFIHIINPEYKNRKKVKPNSIEKFKLVRKKYEEFLQAEILLKEKKSIYYIYKQVINNLAYCGIICGISIDDYINKKIKIHEQTLTKRQKVFKDYLDVCNFNAEPVLLTYPDKKEITAIIEKNTFARPEYDFTTTDGTRHSLWLMENSTDIKNITLLFKNVASVYIADGHHRSASSALLGEERRKNNALYTGDEMFNFLLAYLIPESNLHIYEFNRLVKTLNGITPKVFLKSLEKDFIVENTGTEICRPKKLHQFSIYIDKNWYLINLKKVPTTAKKYSNALDAQILSDKILAPILDIKDLKTDPRIEFAGGPNGLQTLIKKVDSGKFALGICLYPVSVKQLKEIADAEETMPPKSTWIEPKLRSGLTILSME